MKNFLRVLMLVLVFVLAFSVLVACNDKPDDGDTDGTTDGTGEDDGDTTKKLTVTFTYIDKNGNELKDVEGYSSYKMKNIKYGDDVRAYKVDDIKSFEKYVITGWNADKEAAKAGTADANAVKNIKKDTVLYSVVRDKEVKKVTFLKPDGTTVIGTLDYLEGASIGKEAPRPTVAGQYFKEWKFVSNSEEGKENSTTSCVYGACSFQAVMGATDGTIGLVAKDSVVLDGKKDAAYGVKNPEAGEIGAAYLALNNKKTSSDAYTVEEPYINSKGEEKFGSYALPSVVKADTWMLWDGSSIYLLIEVYDTTLTCRSDAYVSKGLDSYFNDGIELWYCFEQDATLETNVTRVGLAAAGDNIQGVAAGQAKYALPRSEHNGKQTGIGGGRSTHFDDIKYAVRNYIYDEDADRDLTGLDAAGVEAPSYTIELKIPARTEGKADETKALYPNGEKLTGIDLEDFRMTGRLYGKQVESNNIDDYAFTPGDDLMVGDYVRFCLQINDLRISRDELNSGNYFDSPKDLAELQGTDEGCDMTEAEYKKSNIALYELGENGKWVNAKTSGKFTAAGSTQHKLSMYLMFSLGGDANGSYKVETFAKGDVREEQVMIGKDGQEYNRSLEVEE